MRKYDLTLFILYDRIKIMEGSMSEIDKFRNAVRDVLSISPEEAVRIRKQHREPVHVKVDAFKEKVRRWAKPTPDQDN